MLKKLGIALLLTAWGAPSLAAPCEEELYRQFDFWMGEWQVSTPDGQIAGTNRIERQEGLCLLVERWKSVQGTTGQSYNFVEPNSGMWRQVWVSQGVVIDIKGGLTITGSMRLEGEISYHANGRVTGFTGEWTPNGDGTVTQTFNEYDDTTQSWKPWFTGIYRRPEAAN